MFLIRVRFTDTSVRHAYYAFGVDEDIEHIYNNRDICDVRRVDLSLNQMTTILDNDIGLDYPSQYFVGIYDAQKSYEDYILSWAADEFDKDPRDFKSLFDGSQYDTYPPEKVYRSYNLKPKNTNYVTVVLGEDGAICYGRSGNTVESL